MHLINISNKFSLALFERQIKKKKQPLKVELKNVKATTFDQRAATTEIRNCSDRRIAKVKGIERPKGNDSGSF